MPASVSFTEDDISNAHPAERQLFDLIRQINEQDPPHLLQERLKLNGNLDELMAELCEAEAEVYNAARRLVWIKAAIRTVVTSKQEP